MLNLQNILESGHQFNDHELSLKFKFKLVNTIILVIILTSTLFGLLHYFSIAPIGDFHANVNFVFAFSNLLLIIWLRLSKSAYDKVVLLMLLSALATFTSALITIPNDEFRIMWFYITLFLAFFTGGIAYGYATAAASILIILTANALFDLNLSALAITTAITGLLILTLTLKVYTKKMIDLEQALLSLNDTLSIEVQKAVAEVRTKDKFMLHQARLAQMGEMIAMIAHQWRQPLSSISAISTNLQLSLALQEEVSKESLELALKSIDNRVSLLSNTIDDFRNFYNTDNETRTFDLSKTITQAIEVLAPAIDNANVTLTFEDRLKSHINSLESELIQVLMNIIKNAIDILRERDQERTITIQAYQDTTQTYINIKDNGGGVSEKIIHKLFDPYFSTKKEKHGMGLGLYMSQLIIQEHCDGILSVLNSEDGAIFTISLPTKQT